MMGAVEQRLSLVTLGVGDLEASRRFYEALGWRPAASPDGVYFFQAGGMVFALWGRDELAVDSGVTDDGGWGGITLAHNVSSPAEVDAVIEEARAAGATIAREPAETFWGGYSGVFVDPDGHPWEVAHNPGWPLGEDGSITLRHVVSAGYSGTPLPRKLGIGEGSAFVLVDAPDGVAGLLEPLPDGARPVPTPAEADVVLVFLTQRATLEGQARRPRRGDLPRPDALGRLAEARVEGADRPHGGRRARRRAAARPRRRQGRRRRRDMVGPEARLAARAPRRLTYDRRMEQRALGRSGVAVTRVDPRLRELRRHRLRAGVLRQGNEPRRRVPAPRRGVGAGCPHARHRRRVRWRAQRDVDRRVAQDEGERRCATRW